MVGCACVGNAGTFSLPPRVSVPNMHHGTCVTHVPWCILWPLTSGFLWSVWRGKHSRHFRRMRNPKIYVSGHRPIGRLPVETAWPWYSLPEDQWCRWATHGTTMRHVVAMAITSVRLCLHLWCAWDLSHHSRPALHAIIEIPGVSFIYQIRR